MTKTKCKRETFYNLIIYYYYYFKFCKSILCIRTKLGVDNKHAKDFKNINFKYLFNQN